jgi:hypothetical protein
VGALDGEDAGDFREIAVVAQVNADGSDFGGENGVSVAGGGPAFVFRALLGGERGGFFFD